MLTALLISQLAIPQTTGPTGDVREVFSHEDFPVSLQANGESGVVYSRTTVRPDGKIAECIAEISSGNRTLDNLTCRIIMKRAKFRPGRWTDGSPVYGVIRMPISWIVSDVELSREQMARFVAPDLEISVSQLPAGAASIVSFHLQLGVDAEGTIVDCLAKAPTERDERNHLTPELVPLACKQAKAQMRMKPPHDDKGNAVRSVQTVLVEIKSGK